MFSIWTNENVADHAQYELSTYWIMKHKYEPPLSITVLFTTINHCDWPIKHPPISLGSTVEATVWGAPWLLCTGKPGSIQEETKHVESVEQSQPICRMCWCLISRTFLKQGFAYDGCLTDGFAGCTSPYICDGQTFQYELVSRWSNHVQLWLFFFDQLWLMIVSKLIDWQNKLRIRSAPHGLYKLASSTNSHYANVGRKIFIMASPKKVPQLRFLHSAFTIITTITIYYYYYSYYYYYYFLLLLWLLLLLLLVLVLFISALCWSAVTAWLLHPVVENQGKPLGSGGASVDQRLGLVEPPWLRHSRMRG